MIKLSKTHCAIIFKILSNSLFSPDGKVDKIICLTFNRSREPEQ